MSLLKDELKLAGVNVEDLVPGWAQGFDSQNQLFAELLVALNAPIHEGLIPPYGSIILPSHAHLGALELGGNDLELARKAADGSSSLIAFRGNEFIGLHLLDPRSTPELELARTTEQLDAIALRRDRNGVVRFFAQNGSIKCTGRQWRVSLPVASAIDKVLQVASMIDPVIFRKILALAPWADTNS